MTSLFFRVLVAVGGICMIAFGAMMAFGSSETYRAQIAVAIKPNLGGLRINSYTDASAQSVEWTQPELLMQVAPDLRGAAAQDPASLNRIVCTPRHGDRIVLCDTQSSDEAAAKAVLNQLVSTVIPIQSAVMQQSYRLTIGEHQEQYRSVTRKDRELRQQIEVLTTRRSKRGVAQRLAFRRLQLSVNVKTQPRILARIASLRRQIAHTRASFQILGPAKIVSR